MNTTPSTSSYSVLAPTGTIPHNSRFDERISLVLLNRNGWLFRAQVLEQLHEHGFFEILSLEHAPLKFDYEQIQQHFPEVRFIVVPDQMTFGEQINIAVHESRGDRFLVLWDDQHLLEAGLHTKISKQWAQFSGVGLTPELRDKNGLDLPVVMVPTLDRGLLKILPLPAEDELNRTLFPYDYCGYFHRNLFLQTGGYDPKITNPFWQKADWGMRCHLWGSGLSLLKSFRVDYHHDLVMEDQTPDESYARFYLKNLALRFQGDHGVLPRSRFWSYWQRSGLPLGRCLKDFRQQRLWVEANRYRFRSDARWVLEHWGQQ